MRRNGESNKKGRAQTRRSGEVEECETQHPSRIGGQLRCSSTDLFAKHENLD